jgi:hypothetical protein
MCATPAPAGHYRGVSHRCSATRTAFTLHNVNVNTFGDVSAPDGTSTGDVFMGSPCDVVNESAFAGRSLWQRRSRRRRTRRRSACWIYRQQRHAGQQQQRGARRAHRYLRQVNSRLCV